MWMVRFTVVLGKLPAHIDTDAGPAMAAQEFDHGPQAMYSRAADFHLSVRAPAPQALMRMCKCCKCANVQMCKCQGQGSKAGRQTGDSFDMQLELLSRNLPRRKLFRSL